MHSYTVLDFEPLYKMSKELTLADSKINVDQRTVKQLTTEGDLPTHNSISHEFNVVHTTLLVIPLMGWCALIISLLAAFFRTEKKAQLSLSQQTKQNRDTPKRKHSIPCSQCRYFSSNYYVRCAVHPSKVSTVEAVNCPDYHSLR